MRLQQMAWEKSGLGPFGSILHQLPPGRTSRPGKDRVRHGTGRAWATGFVRLASLDFLLEPQWRERYKNPSPAPVGTRQVPEAKRVPGWRNLVDAQD